MKYVVNLLCVLVFAMSFFRDVSILGYVHGSGVINRITYMFTHISIIHFAVNMVAFNTLTKSIRSNAAIALCMVSAFLATYGSELAMPTVGLSGVIYAGLGYIFGLNPKNTNYNLALLLAAIINIVLALFSNTNALVHFLSFIYAAIITFIYRYAKNNRQFQRPYR